MHALSYLVTAATVVAILFAWYRILTVRRRIPGGIMRTICNALAEFVGVFAFGFLAMILFPVLPDESRVILVSLVFICVAAFLVTIANFFGTIASESGF